MSETPVATIRILIVDDHIVVRAGLRALLSGALRFDFERMNELHYYNLDAESAVQGWTTIDVTRAGHCNFQGTELLSAFYELWQQIDDQPPTIPLTLTARP